MLKAVYEARNGAGAQPPASVAPLPELFRRARWPSTRRELQDPHPAEARLLGQEAVRDAPRSTECANETLRPGIASGVYRHPRCRSWRRRTRIGRSYGSGNQLTSPLSRTTVMPCSGIRPESAPSSSSRKARGSAILRLVTAREEALSRHRSRHASSTLPPASLVDARSYRHPRPGARRHDMPCEARARPSGPKTPFYGPEKPSDPGKALSGGQFNVTRDDRFRE